MNSEMMRLALDVGQTSTPEAVQFYILAPLAVIAAIGLLVVKKAVHAALLMAWIMITLAIFYVANGAPFLGMAQVIVYTGAVMMFFLVITPIGLVMRLTGKDFLARRFDRAATSYWVRRDPPGPAPETMQRQF